MGIEELRAALEADGRARVARVWEEAEAEAAQLRELAAADAARWRRARMASEEALARRDGAKRVAKARSDARRRVLQTRSEFLDAVFERAAAALPSDLAADPWREMLVTRAEQAMAHMPAGEVTLLCSPGALSTLEKAFEHRAKVRIEADSDLPAGFQLSSADGAIVVDGTLVSQLKFERPRLAVEVMGRLHDGDASTGGQSSLEPGRPAIEREGGA